MSNLRIPGPTPLSQRVRSSLNAQMISHRGKDYERLQKNVVENLKYFFQTENPIYLLTASGTGGLEFAVVNFFSPGDTVVNFTCGEFGDRWAEICRRYGLRVNQVSFPEGTAVTKEVVKKTLKKFKNLKGVFITHNETGTGVLNDLFAIAPIVKSHPNRPLLLVDSVSALGAVDLPIDKLKIDVLISASQKAWAASPGLAMVAVSPKARERHQSSKMPKYYFDLSKYEKFDQKNQTPATPAVSVLYSLKTSLDATKKQGRERVFKKHLKLKDYFRRQVKKLGLRLVVGDKEASPTVTSMWPPEGVDEAAWRKLLREKYKTVIAGGMGGLKGKIVRVAHMGYVSKDDLDQVIRAFKKSLKEL